MASDDMQKKAEAVRKQAEVARRQAEAAKAAVGRGEGGGEKVLLLVDMDVDNIEHPRVRGFDQQELTRLIARLSHQDLVQVLRHTAAINQAIAEALNNRLIKRE